MSRVLLEVFRPRRWIAWTLAIVGFALTPDLHAQQKQKRSAGGARSKLLPLITEKIVRPGEEKPAVRYWWQNATEPKWTQTDRALRRALRKYRGALMKPSGDVRISRIYRTPDLSIDNAAALASVVGARRIVVGNVEYTLHEGSVLPRLHSVRADATLQIVDAASSRPSIVQTIQFERTLYGDEGLETLLQHARKTVGRGAGRLLGRTVAAASGPVGLETTEGVLAFHDLQRGEALGRIRAFLAQLDAVQEVRVGWATEGVVALELNPGKADPSDTVAYAARTLVNHSFDKMTIQRRKRALGGTFAEFRVDLAEGFGERSRDGEEGGRGRE